MSVLIVDASVAYHWFGKETWSDAANGLLRAKARLIAPELVLAEIANVAWKKLRRGEIELDVAEASVIELPRFITELVPTASIVRAAFALARAMNHSIYDCLYLELARQRNAPFITLDEALITKVMQAEIPISIQHLNNWRP